MCRTTLALAALALALLGGCAATVPDGQVAVRTPGSLTFAAPVPLQSNIPADPTEPSAPARSYAEVLYPYAAMAENVYRPRTSGDASRPRKREDVEAACMPNSAQPIPIGGDWLLQDFPANADELDDVNNLRMQLWARRRAPGGAAVELAAVFRGTEARHGLDWAANLRWFHPYTRDHYELTSDEIAPKLRDWLQARIESGEVAADVKLVATGHSLGGGLAQRLAYSFLAPSNAPTLRISRVYAFDPSPVTGWFSVDKTLRESNADALLIDRILEDGEALSYVRDLIAILLPPSEKRPAIRGMKFNFKHSRNPFANHSMRLISCSLAKYTVPGAGGLDTAPLETQSPPDAGEQLAAGP